MKKIISIMFLGMLMLSLVVASDFYVVQHSYYNNDGDMIRKSYHYFDKTYMENENRYPVYDYRNGYTYRISREYLDEQDWYTHDYKEERRRERKAEEYYDEDWEFSRRHQQVIQLEKRDYENDDYWNDYKDYRREKDYNSDYSYKYISWLGGYQKTKCYNSPPKGKLFYVKC